MTTVFEKSGMWRLLFLVVAVAADEAVNDGETSRKILGSSVVTSVSVIMDAGNGSKVYADAVGKPVSKPTAASDVASPIDLLSPDRYEFYTFDDTGDLVKRLMTLEEIRDIIATGDDDLSLDSLSESLIPEKRVNDVVNNVQNVLKEEIKQHKNPERPQFDTPDVSDSWSMILPAVFGNSGDDINLEKPVKHVTPDTIMVEVSTEQQKTKTTSGGTTSTGKTPMINVEIITNSNSTTEKTVVVGAEKTEENLQSFNHVSKSTKRPFTATTEAALNVERSTVTFDKVETSKRPSVTESLDDLEQASTVNLGTSKKPFSTTESQQTSTVTFDRIETTKKPFSTTTENQQTSTVTFDRTETSKKPFTTTTESQQTSTVSFNKMETSRPTDAAMDNIEQTSTVIFDKMEPFSTTTTEVALDNQEPTSTVSFDKIETSKIPFTTTTDNPETSTLIYEKMAPLETSKQPLTTTDTEQTSTVRFDTTTLRTTEITSTLKPEVPTTETSGPETTSELTSTFPPFSTFFIVANTTEKDLKTESSEYSTNKLPSTTETERTTLDQLLLSSTNIYEINSELSDVTTEKFLIRLTNPATDQTFIESIEQLISQVGTPAPSIPVNVPTTIVEDMILKSGNKTMEEFVAETATVASKLEGTTLPTTVDLSDSVGALLSQVAGDGLTTVENESTTEGTTFVPHIINITIFRKENRTKPAKSDLSLEKQEEDLYNEMRKNLTAVTTVIPVTEQTVVLVTEQTTVIPVTEQTVSSVTEQTVSSVTEESVNSVTEQEQTSTVSPVTEQEQTSTVSSVTEQTVIPSVVITINENKTDLEDAKWTLVSTVAPEAPNSLPVSNSVPEVPKIVEPPTPVDLVPKPLQGFGLEDSTANLDTDVYQFVQLCNELAFGFWKSVTTGISTARSVVVSPFAATSLLAMVFLGARGATSGEMNEILKLDDMVTFNPHLIFKNVSESVESGPDSGVAVSAIVRELYSDRSKGKLLGFYKERVRQFYDGHVEEASFKDIGDTIRRRTNLLVKKNTDGKVVEFLKDGSIVPKAPLAGVSVSLFQTDCSQGSTSNRDGELHFVVLPSLRQRRLIPIPATVYRSNFLAGYEPSLDATAAALGTKDQLISTIFVIPGQQGLAAPGDGLARLEKRLVESSFKKGAWSRLLRSLIPRPGLELQIPRFQHRSLINATQSLKSMGLHELFDAHKADLKGLNGAAHDLHLSDVVQVNEFATCGEGRIGEEHHREVYPATTDRKRRLVVEEGEEPRDYQRAFHDPLHDPSYLTLPLALRPRQARLPEAPRLRFDRPFLYIVRHNPSGLILHMGRFHPRLLP